MKKAALYVRVSTKKQSLQNQILDLEKAAGFYGWDVVKIYRDKISGKGGVDRPAFEELKRDAAQGKYDVVAVWALDRAGRSTIDLINFCNDLKNLGVEFYSHKEGVNPKDSAGKLFLLVSSWFAESERDRIIDRVNLGLERARSEGQVLGRANWKSRQGVLTDSDRAAVVNDKRVNPSMSIRELAKHHGLSVGSVHKILKQAGLAGSGA